MKKSLILLLAITLLYSCSTSSDGSGNSTTTVVPVTPSALVGTVASATQINLTWTDNSTNETGFKIERKTGPGTYAIIGTAAPDVTTFNDSGLTPSSTYTYRVYSYNAVGNSPTYSNEVSVTTASPPPAINVPGPSLTDIDGNTYQSVSNCELTFTKQNLNVSKYSDGTPIPQVTDQTLWANLTTGAWCYYNNTTANGTTYGKLYNGYAVAGIYNAASLASPALRKKLAPTGWHIPTKTEWIQLNDCLGGDDVAGGKMKAIGTLQAGTGLWEIPNTAANNESGFTGLPGGYRTNSIFTDVGKTGLWWSATPVGVNGACTWCNQYNNSVSGRNNSASNIIGSAVRCIKD